MTLRFSEKDEIKAMSKSFTDVMIARASIQSLDSVVIKGIGFPKLTPEQEAAAPDHLKDFQDLQDALITTIAHGLTWSNDIEPQITLLPQSYININAFVDAWRPKIASLSEQQKVDTLVSQAARLSSEALKLDAFAAELSSLLANVKIDAANFSSTHAAFAELEALDAENIKCTTAAITKIKAVIAEESQKIDVDLSDAEKLIGIAKGVMEAGEKVKSGTEADELVGVLTVTAGLIMIGIAEGKIDEALEAINERLANATKEAGFEMNLTALTLQLLALQTAHSSIQAFLSDLTDVKAVFVKAAGWYRAREKDITDLLDGGVLNVAIDEVAMLAYANSWSDLCAAGKTWQSHEINGFRLTPNSIFKVPLAPFDPAIAPV